MYQVSENIAQTNSAISHYIARGTPTGEINHAISWLKAVRDDCDFKIDQLKKIKQERDRAKAWRDNINGVAKDFYGAEYDHLDDKTMIRIIMQRLDIDHKRAQTILDLIAQWRKKEKTKIRNDLIILDCHSGLTPSKIARKHGISRQQVYNIITDHKRQKFIK